MKSIHNTGEADILDRLVEPTRATLSAAAAKAILKLKFSAVDVDKMNELAQKARQGKLTKAEHRNIEDYERVGQFISLMKSKARRSLRAANGDGK